MELISIIVPVYNSEKYLHRCIGSILQSSYSNFELLLIDDGSSDKSADICKYYTGVDHRVHYFRKENGGVSSARNMGIDFSYGQHIVFVDSDDYIKINLLDELIKSPSSDFSMCGYEVYNDFSDTVITTNLCHEFNGSIHDFSSLIG